MCARTATTAFVPLGYSSMLYSLYLFVRAMGACGVCRGGGSWRYMRDDKRLDSLRVMREQQSNE